jgi:hypothetical protein
VALEVLLDEFVNLEAIGSSLVLSTFSLAGVDKAVREA